MAFANSAISDLIATGIDSRTGEIADNVSKSNALLARLRQRGKVKTVSGGVTILQELAFQENANGGWFDGYDPLPVQAADVISAAQFQWKQAAVPVIISGREQRQNSGRERIISLVESRIEVAESTLANIVAQGVYSDGTGTGGKQLTGLLATIPSTVTASQTDTYGGISRTTWAFWRASVTSVSATISTAATTLAVMNTQWATQVRGNERPDLVIMDNIWWGNYTAALQAQQRFTNPDTAALGFPSLKYMDADVVLDGGIGGFANAYGVTSPADDAVCYFLNTKYLFFRPHTDANFVSMNPNRRYSVNQDAEVQILHFMGNLTCSGAQFQGKVVATTVA